MASADGNFFSTGALNYLFLAEVLVVSITLIFFLFFWSRVVGTLFGWVLKVWLWRKHRIWIEFDALQISPLSGHILFKELKYFSANMSVRAVHGHIAWRYWIWRVREEGDDQAQGGEGEGSSGKRRKAPTRIILKINGLEWCLFNRTPAFDEIIARMEEQEKREAKEKKSEESGGGEEAGASVGDGPRRRNGWKEGGERGTSEEEERLKGGGKVDEVSPSTSSESQRHHPAKEPLPTSMFVPSTVETTSTAVNWLREALPMEVHILTGGFTFGNDATPSLLFLAFKEGLGVWEAAKTRSKLDDYKSVHSYTLTGVKLVTRTNPDYRGPVLDHGRHAFKEIRKQQPLTTPALTLSSLTYPLFAPLLKLFPFLSSTTFFGSPAANPVLPSSETWKGLPRYRAGADANDRGGLGTLPTEREKQYAKVTTLIDSKEVELRYYSDVAGLVPANARSMDSEAGLEDCDVGNGDLAPEWGLDLVFRGGTITYGPWADRQRDTLQKAFTPAVFAHSQPTPKLKPGEPRLHTSMKVFVKFEEQAALLIPHRESSKDWEYDSEGPGAGRLHSTRRHGLLAVALGAGSTMNYSMGMVSSHEGYKSSMILHLSQLVVTSSINTKEFVWAENCRVSCKMPSPLQWNTRRDWVFDVSLTKPTINLLRDHITQLSDLAKDWTSGPGTDFFHFVPYQYTFKVALQEYALRLNLNDHNIIDAPSSLDDNVFLVLSGPRLDSTVDIPSTKFSQKSTEVTFQIEASKLKASMSLPLWSTNNSFGTERTKDLGTFGILDVTGSYLFFSETDPDHVETLAIDVLTRGIEFKTFGWAIRHIFRIKDNYFGSFTNFTTLPEYREKKDANAIGDPVAAKYRAGKSDVFEIDLTVTIHEGSLIFPEDLHDCRKALLVSSPEIQVSLRLHDYFMEVVFALQPVKFSTKNMLAPDEPTPAREDAIMVDGVNLVGNRLFGPQPQTATYLCLWEADLGRVTGHTSPAMLSTLQKVGKTFALNFTDKGNSPPPNIELAVDPDITFFKVSIGAVDFTVWSPASAINVILPSGFVFETNDLATESYRSMMSVSLPQLDARILLPPSTPSHNWWEVSALSLDLALDMYLSPTGWLESAEEQAAFVISQDEMTRRVAQLYDPKIKAGPVSHLNGLYLPPPVIPRRPPVKEETYYISESEDETSASEAASLKSSTDDDDADVRSFRFPPHRRASGSASFFTAYEDNAEISDGDESDNSTSTNTSSSGNSTSTILPTSKAVLQHSTFSAVLDRYRLLRPSEIFCGHGAAVKVETSRKTAAPIPSPSTPDPPPPPSKRSRRSSVIRRPSLATAPASNRVVRVSSRRDIRFLFTPLSIGPLRELLSGLAESTDSPGQVLDDLVDIDASATPNEPPVAPKAPSPSSFILELDISGIRVQSILRVLTKEEVKAISESSSVARGASPSGDLHARIEWNAKAIKLLVSSSTNPVVDGNLSTSALGHESPLPSETSLDASLSVDSSILRVLQATSSMDGSRNPTPDPEVLRLTTQALVGTFSSTSDNTSLRLNIGDSNLDWLNIASELIIGTVHESLRFFSALDRLNEEIAARRRARIRTVVWEILQLARTQKIETSPACLRPASYLVQSSPTRSSLGWKFLCRLRHCLRVEEAATGVVEFKESESNSGRTDDEMLEDVLPILSDWWQDWPGSMNTFSVDDIPLLDYVFAGRTVNKPVQQRVSDDRPPPPSLFQSLLTRPAVISFTTGRLKANHRATLASDSTDGALIIGPYSFIARTWSEDEEMSYASPASPRTLRIVVQSVLGDGTARITPALLHVIRHILKVRKVFESKMIVLEQAREQIPRTPSRKTSGLALEWNKIVLEATMGFKTGSVEVDVEELGVRAFSKSGAIITKVVVDFPSIASKRILSAPSNLSTSLILRLQDLKVSAEQKDQQDEAAQLLAEITVQGADSVTSFSQGENSSTAGALSAVFAVEKVRSQAPANIARLYEFSESWIKKSKNHQSTLEEIIKEFDPEDNPARDLKPHPKSELGRIFPSINLNILLKRLDFDIRITPRLWVCWTLHDVLAFVSRPEGRQEGAVSFEFGLQLGLQSLRFVPTKASLLQLPSDSSTTSTMTVSFPSIKTSGIYGKPPGSAAARVELVVTIDFVDVVFQPDVLDSLYAVFGQIGRDMSQLEDLLVKARRARSSSSSAPVSKVETPSSDTQLLHTIRFALRGFKIGLKGPSSIQYIEASILQGEVSSPVGSSQEPLWSFSVDELALSLAQTSLRHASSPSTETSMDRRYRSAHVTVNFRAQNHPFDGPRQPRTRQATYGKPELRVLQVRLDQVHGTLQAAAVGELGDLFDHYGVELQRRKKQRSAEFEEIKSRAARVWQADEPQETVGEPSEPPPSWLEDREIQVQVQHVGFAFPLSREEIKSTFCSDKTSSVPAFVVSVRELNFTTRRDEDGAGEIKDVSLQFTSRFDQGDVNSFDGLSHQTYNRVHFPLLKGNVRSKSSSGLRLVSVDSEVSAFQLTLDSALPSYVFALIDVYEQGKKRLDRLAVEHNFEQFYGQGTQVVDDHGPSISRKKSLEVQATFEFNAGHVSLFSYSDAEDLRGGLDGTPASKKPRDPEVFVLPTVSMWCEYHDKVASTSSPSSSSSLPEVTTGPALLVNTTVHGTSNSISPDVLPFFVQIMHTIDHRPPKFDPPSPEVALITLPSSTSTSQPQEPLQSLQTPPPPPPESTPSMGNMQISISLQINKSMLKVLTSREDLTEVTIAWESGGFIFNVAPGFHSLSMAGRVGGVTMTFINKNLHASDKEESLQASAQNLSLAISLSPEDPSGGLHRVDRRILSLTLDTEFSSSFDFVRFEDILCFKAVWLDRIPVPLASIPTSIPRPSRRRTSSSAVHALTLPDTSPPPVVADLKSNLTTIVLVRIRKITQTVHSKLTTLQLDILDVVIRVRLAGGVEKYSFGIGEIKVQADRALTGQMSFPRLEFDVERRRRSSLTSEHSTLVSLAVKTGEIEANLMAGGNAILKLSCGPIALSITDDWTGVIGSTSSSQTIGLSFIVDLGTFNLAITTQTVPDLLKIYSGYLEQIDDAVRSAVRFSSSYARHHNAKPAQNLSAVANDFVQSTRTKLRNEADNVTFTIVQSMTLQSAGISVVLYAQSFADKDLVRLDLGAVEARLGRTVAPRAPPQTRLDLRLAFLKLKKWSSSVQPPSLEEKEVVITTQAWLKRVTAGSSSRILLLPETKIMMDSTEDPARTIRYDFAMSFGGAVDSSLNYAHLKWLGALITTFETKIQAGLARVDADRAKAVGGGSSVNLDRPTSATSDSDSSSSLLPKPLVAAPSTSTPQISLIEPHSPFIYIARSEDIQELQLSHLGEATPSKSWVPWVQSQFSKSSKWTHEYATRPLVVLMEGLLGTYKKQLPKS